MAEELIISQHNGTISKIEKVNSQWKITFSIAGGGTTYYVVDTAYVVPCQAIKIGDNIGVVVGGGSTGIGLVNPYRLLGNETGTRTQVREIALGKFLKFTNAGLLEVDLKIITIKFRVGIAGGPQAGDFSFVLKDKAGNLVGDMDIFYLREGDKQDQGRHFEYDTTTSMITNTVDFEALESVFIRLEPKDLYDRVPGTVARQAPADDGELEPTDQLGFDYALPIIL